jgi:hypothetical protein
MPLNAVPSKNVVIPIGDAVVGDKPFMTVEPQCRAHWCWAAVCVSIARRFGHELEQASFARQVLGDSFPDADCTVPPCDATSTKCSIPALTLPIDMLPISYEKVPGPLSKADLIEEMRNKRPVAAKIVWQSASKPAGGHYIAIVGMSASGGDVLFHPGDPMDGNVQAVPYEKLLRYQEDGDWKVSWRKGG